MVIFFIADIKLKSATGDFLYEGRIVSFCLLALPSCLLYHVHILHTERNFMVSQTFCFFRKSCQKKEGQLSWIVLSLIKMKSDLTKVSLQIWQMLVRVYVQETFKSPFVWHCFSDFLKRPLENYVKKLRIPVYVIRMEQRSGLIRARLKGAAASKGQVITFLDAHCECTVGWLEPLLARIKANRWLFFKMC